MFTSDCQSPPILLINCCFAEITIIKRDFELLRKLIPSLTPDVQTQMLPYSALFCYEAMAYLKKYNPSLGVKQTSKASP